MNTQYVEVEVEVRSESQSEAIAGLKSRKRVAVIGLISSVSYDAKHCIFNAHERKK